jgi:hypothetical protein
MRNIKKTGLILSILFICTLSVNAQNTFELLIENNYDEILFDVTELPDGNFILTGTFEDPSQAWVFHGYLIKINENGVITNSVYLNEYSYCMLHNIHFYNNKLYVIAALQENADTNFTLGLFRLNTDLEILDVKTNVLPGNKQIGFVNSIIDSDSNLVMCCAANNYNESGGFLGSDSFIYKTSMTGDSLNSIFFNEYLYKLPCGIIENNDSTGYHVFAKYCNNNYNCSKLFLNKDLEEISLVGLSSEIYTIDQALHYATQASPIRINDSSILLSGRYQQTNSETHFAFTMSDNDSIMSTTFIENENRIQWANTYGNSINGNNIYSGYTSNVSYSNFYYSHDTSHIHILKFDEQLNTIWHKVIGGDAYYNLYRVLACSDGGCLLVANKFEYEDNPDEIRNIYIAKLNQDGEFVWQREFQRNSIITLFPNPAQNTIHLNIPENIYINGYKIFNMQGVEVINEQNYSGSINISSLSSGTYVIEMKTNTGVISERFVKIE